MTVTPQFNLALGELEEEEVDGVEVLKKIGSDLRAVGDHYPSLHLKLRTSINTKPQIFVDTERAQSDFTYHVLITLDDALQHPTDNT